MKWKTWRRRKTSMILIRPSLRHLEWYFWFRILWIWQRGCVVKFRWRNWWKSSWLAAENPIPRHLDENNNMATSPHVRYVLDRSCQTSSTRTLPGLWTILVGLFLRTFTRGWQEKQTHTQNSVNKIKVSGIRHGPRHPVIRAYLGLNIVMGASPRHQDDDFPGLYRI